MLSISRSMFCYCEFFVVYLYSSFLLLMLLLVLLTMVLLTMVLLTMVLLLLSLLPMFLLYDCHFRGKHCCTITSTIMSTINSSSCCRSRRHHCCVFFFTLSLFVSLMDVTAAFSESLFILLSWCSSCCSYHYRSVICFASSRYVRGRRPAWFELFFILYIFFCVFCGKRKRAR